MSYAYGQSDSGQDLIQGGLFCVAGDASNQALNIPGIISKIYESILNTCSGFFVRPETLNFNNFYMQESQLLTCNNKNLPGPISWNISIFNNTNSNFNPCAPYFYANISSLFNQRCMGINSASARDSMVTDVVMLSVIFGVIGAGLLCSYGLRKRSEKRARAALLFDPVAHEQRREIEMRVIVAAHPM